MALIFGYKIHVLQLLLCVMNGEAPRKGANDVIAFTVITVHVNLRCQNLATSVITGSEVQ